MSLGVFDQLVNSAFYKPIDHNGVPDNTVFQLVVNLTGGAIIGSSTSSMLGIRDHHAPTYNLVMAILNIFTHAVGGKSNSSMGISIRMRMEVITETIDPITKEGICVGYRLFFYYISDVLFSKLGGSMRSVSTTDQAIADLGEQGSPNLDEAEAVRSDPMGEDEVDDDRLNLARRIQELRIQAEQSRESDAASASGDEGAEEEEEEEENDAAEEDSNETIRTMYETKANGQNPETFPLGVALQRSLKEGQHVKGVWIENAKKAYRSGISRSQAERMSDVLLHPSQDYHVENIRQFYEQWITPYLSSDPYRIPGYKKPQEFFDEILNGSERDMEADVFTYHDNAHRANFYYDPRIQYERGMSSEQTPGAIDCYASPFYRFQPIDSMFLHTQSVCKEQKDVCNYLTSRIMSHDALKESIENIPRRVLMTELDQMGLCDSDFSHYPFPRLVFDVDPHAVHPEVFIHASFPFKVGQMIPAEMFLPHPLPLETEGDGPVCDRETFFVCSYPLYAYSDEMTDQDLNTMKRLIRRNGEDSGALKTFSRSVYAVLVEKMRSRLSNLYAEMRKKTAFINNTNPGGRGYPITNDQYRLEMDSMKVRYNTNRANGSTNLLVSAKLHIEWTGTVNNHESSIMSSFYGLQDNSENDTLARVVENGAVGDEDDTRTSREKRILAQINAIEGEATEDDISRPMLDQVGELEKIDFVYRLRRQNLFAHRKIREDHTRKLADVNAERHDLGLPPIELENWPPYQKAHQSAVVGCLTNFLNVYGTTSSISHGMAAHRDFDRSLPFAEKTIESVDTKLALRPFSMFLADINSLFSDFAGVSHLYSLMTTAYFYRLDAMMMVYENQECNTHLGLMGETSVGKSFLIDWTVLLCPPKSTVTAEDITDKALRGNFNDMILAYHEIPERIFSKNPAGGNADSINGMKSKIANGFSVVIAYHVDPKTGERGYSISFLSIRAVYLFATNSTMRDADPAFLDRFAARGVPKKKHSFVGTSVMDRSWAKEALDTMEQNEVVQKHRKLMTKMGRVAKAYASGCYGEDFLQYISNNLIKQFVKNFKETNGGKSKLSNRGMTRVLRLTNVMGIMYAVWLVYATDMYLYNMATPESVCWTRRNQPDNETDLEETTYEDNRLPYREQDLQNIIESVEVNRTTGEKYRSASLPLDTHAHLAYTIPFFTGITKEAVMAALELSKDEFMELDSDHFFRHIVSLSGIGTRPANTLSFRQVKKRINASEAFAVDQDSLDEGVEDEHANYRRKYHKKRGVAQDEMEMDVNYIYIPFDSYENLIQQLIHSFDHIVPSEAQVRMVLMQLRKTMVNMVRLSYDSANGKLVYANGENGDQYHQDAILHYKPEGKRGGACSIQVSVAYLINHFGLSLDMVNEGTVDPRILSTTGGDGVGNPIHPSEPATRNMIRGAAKVDGVWGPPTYPEIREVHTLADAQNFSRIHEYDQFISEICKLIEGPFLERSNLPIEEERKLYASLGVPSNPNPVFDYAFHRPVRPYLDHSIVDMRRSRTKKDIDGGRSRGIMIKTKTHDDTHQATIAGWHRLSILTMRRLAVSEGGNVLHFEQHNQISKVGKMLNPSRKRKFEEMLNGGMRKRIREADNIHFGKYDPDLVVALRSIHQNAHFRFPMRLAYSWPLVNEDHPIAFAPFTMLHLRFINSIEASIMGKTKLEYTVYPGYSLLEDIRKRRNIENSRYDQDNSSGEIAILGKKIEEKSLSPIFHRIFDSNVGAHGTALSSLSTSDLVDDTFVLPPVKMASGYVHRPTISAQSHMVDVMPIPASRGVVLRRGDGDAMDIDPESPPPAKRRTKRIKRHHATPIPHESGPPSFLPSRYTNMDDDDDGMGF
jgi:hypothetical protein